MAALSVYRQGQALTRMEEHEIIRDASTLDDIDIVYLAIKHDKPALIGLKGEYAIVKNHVDGDEAHSFQALYDSPNCLTISDLMRMRQADVKDPEHLPEKVFRVQFSVPAGAVLNVFGQIKALGRPELISKVKQFMDDEQFLKEFYDALMQALLGQVEFGHTKYIMNSIEEMKDPPPDAPEWRFEDPDQ